MTDFALHNDAPVSLHLLGTAPTAFEAEAVAGDLEPAKSIGIDVYI